jgi:pyruvyltransferase
LIELYSWNPGRPLMPGLLGRRLARAGYAGAPMNNFGDLLGPEIVKRMLASEGVDLSFARSETRLLSVGSVLHFARDGDTIWGTGRNGKESDANHRFSQLDVRAVRGPLTAKYLESRGITAPSIFGDPGVLTAQYFSELSPAPGQKKHVVTIVPNLNDLPKYRRWDNLLDPRTSLEKCIERIANSELVVGSSLHGIVVAESFGVPARLIGSNHESKFKYEDYYLGTGRSMPRTAMSVDEALQMGGVEPMAYDPAALIEAFPYDLWERVR